MLFTLHLRADSLVGALEGAARSVGTHKADLASLMAEIGRQPGIAWLALVNPDGRILADSNPGLTGSLLYTPTELMELQPSLNLQGRIGLDDPDIYETWKLFAPSRLRGHGYSMLSGGSIIFVALNAAGMRDSLSAYRLHLWLLAGLGLGALCTGLALIYFIRNYLTSHRKLKDAEAMAQQVIQSYPTSLIAVDPSGRVIFRNGRAEEMLSGLAASQKLQDWTGLDWGSLYADLIAGKTILEQERELVYPSGRRAPVNLSAAPIRDSAGKRSGYLIVISDLSKVKRLEHKLAESRRLSTLGRLASGLAHEIRNPLSSICGYACYLEGKLPPESLEAATARLLVDESRRLNNVLSDLLHLAREPRLQRRLIPLARILQKVESLATPDAENRQLQLKLVLPTHEEALASVDPDRLLQALLNLVLNAVQAAPEASEITLALESPSSTDLPLELNPELGYWRIQIHDCGPGMTDQQLNQIFTPYFTTRVNGVGLGLPIARQIVESHGGVIKVDSKLGHGSVFSVYIPQKAEE